MRTIILMLFLLMSSCASAQEAPDPMMKRVELVIARLCKAAGSTSCPKTALVPYFVGLAYTDGTTVTISRHFLIAIKSDDELAFILGHELGHIIAGHGLNFNYTQLPEREYEADQIGILLVVYAGYRCSAGAELFKRYIDHPTTPPIADRILRIYESCHKLGRNSP